jgi:hypothetical protein
MTQLEFEMARSKANTCVRALSQLANVNYELRDLAPDLIPDVDKVCAAVVEKLVAAQAIVNQGFPRSEASY